MTRKEKEELIEKLRYFLHYFVKVKVEGHNKPLEVISMAYGSENDTIYMFAHDGEKLKIVEAKGSVRPYLFPMSSMTQAQKKTMELLYKYDDTVSESFFAACGDMVDWLNRNHFDYGGLIKKGLALDATGLGIYD